MAKFKDENKFKASVISYTLVAVIMFILLTLFMPLQDALATMLGAFIVILVAFSGAWLVNKVING